MKTFEINSKVTHSLLGVGQVVSDIGETVVVRFSEKIEICAKNSLVLLDDIFSLLQQAKSISSLKGLTRFQALAINSINNKWGIFCRSKIDLLPHQLWVCRQAKGRENCRLLIADDVGLGKTIEAGIIISSFLGQKKINRLLILTPSNLVEQWQYRMRTMFDIRLTTYTTDADTPKSGFWNSNNMVIASFHTLRIDHNNRQNRLLGSKPFDLVVVDEAHHFNQASKLGATLGYQLLQKMQENNLIKDLILFTGTPHKGKDYNFLSLMNLLSPEFDLKKDLSDQLHLVKKYMIRNNKYNVTDLHGNLLFKKPIAQSEEYSYSREESEFYKMMTQFISEGLAYAKKQKHSVGSVVTLILIAMQKLASSSVAAITNALEKRLQLHSDSSHDIENAEDVMTKIEGIDELDDKAEELQEKLTTLSIKLMKNERAAIEKLLQQAKNIKDETKINTILNVIDAEYLGEQILFFTEYKATQRVLLEALLRRYGEDSVTIINGDKRLDNVTMPDGSQTRFSTTREHATERFNSKKCRFLIATEAAGEGIDLQENCHILFHVDLPWNPMRLHQRVGRLNRYGQTKEVIVRNFRNPDTVESRIWNRLNEKIARINTTFGSVMTEKEDMFQLVLGMTPPKIFDDLFGKTANITNDDSLDDWFDKNTAMFGGEDIYHVVKNLTGNVSRFDYKNVSSILPKIDLRELHSFWKNALTCYSKRLLETTEGSLIFHTPDEWKSFGIYSKYENLVLHRTPSSEEEILGIGFKVFDNAIDSIKNFKEQVSFCEGVKTPLFILSLQDQLADHASEKHASIYGCLDENNILVDWQLLKLLNKLKPLENYTSSINDDKIRILKLKVESYQKEILKVIKNEDFSPRVPNFTLEGLILPIDY